MSVKAFLARKNIVFSAKRYGVDALGAMAQGLFCTLLVGTILNTLGTQFHIGFLAATVVTIGSGDAATAYTIGGLASAMVGPAMAVAIGAALQAPLLVLFSLVPVGFATNALGGAGGPLAVLVIAIIAAECGKAVSKETKIDILVTPIVTVLVGVGVAYLVAPPIGKAASWVGNLIMWATELQPFFMGILVSVIVGVALPCPSPARPSARPWASPAWPAARRWPAAAPRWWALLSCPSGRTSGAAWCPRAWAPPCSRWATSSATPRSGFPPRWPPPSPAPLPPACSAWR